MLTGVNRWPWHYWHYPLSKSTIVVRFKALYNESIRVWGYSSSLLFLLHFSFFSSPGLGLVQFSSTFRHFLPSSFEFIFLITFTLSTHFFQLFFVFFVFELDLVRQTKNHHVLKDLGFKSTCFGFMSPGYCSCGLFSCPRCSRNPSKRGRQET